MKAAGSNHKLYEGAESAYGVVPGAAVMKRVRNTGCTLKLVKDLLKSNELTGNRQITNAVDGQRRTEGEVSIEALYGAYDEDYERVLCGTWSKKATITATTLSAAAADNSFNDSGNGFVAAGFEVGDLVTVTGFTGDVANNVVRATVTAVAAGKLTIGGTDGDVIVDDAAGESVTIATVADRLKAGSTRRSSVFERVHTDIGQREVFPGCQLNSMNLTINTKDILTGSFGVIGKGVLTLSETAIAGASYSEPTAADTKPLVSFTAELTEGGSSASVTEASIALENGIENVYVVGDATSQETPIGDSMASGSITVLFEDEIMFAKFVDPEVESSLDFRFLDADGNVLRIYLPRIRYSGATNDVKGPGLIPLVMPFQVLYDASLGSNIVLDRIPAAT